MGSVEGRKDRFALIILAKEEGRRVGAANFYLLANDANGFVVRAKARVVVGFGSIPKKHEL